MCDITVLSGAILSRKAKIFLNMENRYFDPRSSYEINAEYVDKVDRFPEHLAVKEDSEILKHFHMNLVNVSSAIFWVLCTDFTMSLHK